MDQTNVPLHSGARSGWDRWVLAVLLVIGAGLRLAWVAHGRLTPNPSEMFNISRSFAITGRLADAYGPGSGPTAHAMPAMPLYAGSVYRLLGVATPGAELTLTLVALLLIGIALLALYEGFRHLGVPPAARLGAIAFLALVPVSFAAETVEFRIWEGAAASAIIAVMLLVALRLDEAQAPPRWTTLAGFAAACGLAAMVSQPAALAGYGMLGLLALRRRGVPGLAATIVLSALLLALISLPWALRNQAVLGEMIWSRSNFGYNLATGFHDRAVDPVDPKAVFMERLSEVDPYQGPAALVRLKAAGGEAAYNRLWTQRTVAWIERRPLDATRIAIRHAADFYFPPQWLWSIYSNRGCAAAIKEAALWGLSLFGLVGLAIELVRRNWRHLYVAAALALTATPYILVQPVLRYHYPIYGVMTFLAAGLLCRIAQASRSWRVRSAARVS